MSNPARVGAGVKRIGHHDYANKTEYMCFNQRGNISTLNGCSMKLVGKFTYQESSGLLTQKDINTRLAKAWTTINRLSVIWKSDMTDKIKRIFFFFAFFQAAVVSILQYGCTTRTQTKRMEKKLTKECCEQNFKSPWGSTPQNSSCSAT